MGPVPLLLEKGSGAVVELLLPLNAVDLEAHGHQDCTLVAAPRADLQNLGP